MEKFKDWGKGKKTFFIFCFFVLPILIILEGSNPPMPVIFTFLGFYLFMRVLGWIMDLLGISDGSSTLDDDGD